jgi:hypothetical protein
LFRNSSTVQRKIQRPQFLVPDRGNKVDYGTGLSPGYIGWRAGIRQPFAIVSPVRDYEFGYRVHRTVLHCSSLNIFLDEFQMFGTRLQIQTKRVELIKIM